MLKSTIRDLQQLLDRQRVLALAVLADGAPYAGLLPFVAMPRRDGRERYVGKFPDSRITFNLGDFTLYRLEFLHGLYVAGFGRAMEISAGDVKKLAERP